MEKAVAQQFPRLDGDQVAQRDDMLLGDRVGEIGVDPDLLHVGHNQQRRVLQRVGVLLQLRIGLDQVFPVALVFPRKTLPLPNVGKAGCVADLPGRLLKGVFGAVPIDVARFRYSKDLAQIEKMLLSRGSFGTGGAPPFGNEIFGPHARVRFAVG